MDRVKFSASLDSLHRVILAARDAATTDFAKGKSRLADERDKEALEKLREALRLTR